MAAALTPAAPSRVPHSRGAATLGRRRNERRREEGTSGRRNASVCGKRLVGASAGGACGAAGRHAAPGAPVPALGAQAAVLETLPGRALANPPLKLPQAVWGRCRSLSTETAEVSVQRILRSLAHSVPCHSPDSTLQAPHTHRGRNCD